MSAVPWKQQRSAFTLLELMTVIVIIAILAVLLFPAYTSLMRRAEKIRCIGNLRTLYFGANSYVQDHGYWPQIDPQLIKDKTNKYGEAWQAALAPFGVPQESWICPTVQRELNNPDYKKSQFGRVDYIATPFDSKRITPYLWPTQPWFLERGDVHGNGNQMIFTDGHVSELNELKKTSGH